MASARKPRIKNTLSMGVPRGHCATAARVARRLAQGKSREEQGRAGIG
jgi:hypothetical protein